MVTTKSPAGEQPEDEERGLLDPVVDTSVLGVLDTPTAQVSILLPTDEDESDDDVVDDEPLTLGMDRSSDDELVSDSSAADEEITTFTGEIDEVDSGGATSDLSFEDLDEDSEVDAAPVDSVIANEEEPAPEAVTETQVKTETETETETEVGVAEVPLSPEPVTLVAARQQASDAGRERAEQLTADRLVPGAVPRPEPEGGWSRLVYRFSAGRLNPGDGRRVRERKALTARIAAPIRGRARFVSVLSRKGGVGKTTVTTLVGMALADAREDRVIAVDANPDRGTLADRITRESRSSIRDLVRDPGDIADFSDMSGVVARDSTRLDVLASDTDPARADAFDGDDYRVAADIAGRFYSLVLTDTGTGMVHETMAAALERADQLVIVSGAGVDSARLASETLSWLEVNGYAEPVRQALVVLNQSAPGRAPVDLDELEAHFRSRVRAVVRLPYDPLLATGSAIDFAALQPQTRAASREIAALVVEGLSGGVTHGRA